MVLDVRGFQMMPDMSGLNNNIGALINRQISDKLVGKAMAGDETAQVNLAARDPQQSQQLGKIFARQDDQALQEREQGFEDQDRAAAILGPLAKGYVNASDKKGYLAGAARKLREAGFDEYATNVENDLATYDENPAAVDEDYNSAVAIFGQSSGTDGNVRSSTPLFGGRLRQIERRDGTMETLDAAGNPIAPEDVPAAWEAAEKAHLAYEQEKYGSRAMGAKEVAEAMDGKIAKNTAMGAIQGKYENRGLSSQTAAEIAWAETDSTNRARRLGALEEALPMKQAQLTSNLRKIDNTLANVTEAMGLANWGTTGWAGMVLQNLPSDANTLKALITSIKANLGLDELNAMKAMSTSGGSGMGALAVAELEALQSVVTNIHSEMKPDVLKRELMKINDHYMRYKQELSTMLEREQGLLEQYKSKAPANTQEFAPATAGQEPASELSLDELLNQYGD